MDKENTEIEIQISTSEKSDSTKSRIFAALFLLTVLGAIFFIDYGKNFFAEEGKIKEGAQESPIANIASNPFENLEIEAKAAYVYDAATGEVLYSQNEEERLPLASLSKLMTALVAGDLIPQSTVVRVESGDIAIEGDSGLLVGEKWKLRDIIDYTLMTSSNDGASAIATVAGSLGQSSYGESPTLAKHSFVGRMNEKSEEIGLLHTYFLNESGLDIDKKVSGSYGTAKDVAQLMRYIIENKPLMVESTAQGQAEFTSLDDIEHFATNTNITISDLPGLIASKTGFTELAGGNLVVAVDAGPVHPIIIAVLGSSIEGRFSDVRKLFEASMESLKIKKTD